MDRSSAWLIASPSGAGRRMTVRTLGVSPLNASSILCLPALVEYIFPKLTLRKRLAAPVELSLVAIRYELTFGDAVLSPFGML